ncbi:MAG: class I SAM-dependent methyltransferase [Planctomycetota bacterium]
MPNIMGDGVPKRPDWRPLPGVSPGTWRYATNQSIASGYGDFVRQTPLCGADEQWVVNRIQQHCDTSEVVVEGGNSRIRIADFGCGNGRVAHRLAQHGWDVLAIDLSMPMLRSARALTRSSVGEPDAIVPMTDRQACDGHGGSRARVLTLRCNLVEMQSIAENSFDHGICLFSTIGMIRESQHRREFLAHAARTIRPGGQLLLHAHNRWSAWHTPAGVRQAISDCWQRVRGRRQTDGSPLHPGDRQYAYRGLGDMYLHTFYASELERDFRAAGWTRIRLDALSKDSARVIGTANWFRRLTCGGFLVAASRDG